MRVAIVGDFPRDPNRIQGGVEAVVAYLARGLMAFTDLEVHTVTLKPRLVQEQTVEWKGVTAHYVPASFRLANLTRHRVNKQRLQATLTYIAPDVVHAHIAGVYAQAAIVFGQPWLLTIHGIRYREAALWPGPINRFRQQVIAHLERDSIARAGHIIAISPYVEDEFSRNIRGQVYRLENPIDERFFALNDQEWPDMVLFVGRIIPRKGAFELVKAIEQVRREIPNLQLRMAGGPLESQAPGYMAMIEDYVRTHDLSRHVTFLGQVSEDDMFNEYASCALVALPARQETAPMAIQEAMAAGKAVVSTRAGGIPYLVDHNRTGLLVESGDVDGLAAAITILLRDSSLRRRMGQAAKVEAEHRFRADHVAARTREIYYQVINRPVPAMERASPARQLVRVR
jgi:glycosyltransferase involved in cell wall biosynthesis